MKPDKKGKPSKKQSESTRSWTKILIVLGCIVFAVAMIGSIMTPSSLESFFKKPAQSGDTAVVDITLRDALGRPVFTTNENIYSQAVEKKQAIWKANYLTLTVNETTDTLVQPISSSIDGLENEYFALLGPEMNQVTENLVGMKEKNTKQIKFVEIPQFRNVTYKEDFERMGGNFSGVTDNQQMVLGFTMPSMITDGDNSTPQYALRTVLLSNKTSDTITIDYGYKTADIHLLQLTPGT
jgi:hypothetical protein